MIETFVEDVYRSWLEQAITYNAINLPMTKYDLFADNVTYRARGFSWVDPQKEISASIQAVSNGIISLQDVHAQYGKDTEEVFEAISREKDLAEQYNIKTAFEPFGNKAPAQPEVDGQADGDVQTN